jgi:hypothetical protein
MINTSIKYFDLTSVFTFSAARLKLESMLQLCLVVCGVFSSDGRACVVNGGRGQDATGRGGETSHVSLYLVTEAATPSR